MFVVLGVYCDAISVVEPVSGYRSYIRGEKGTQDLGFQDVTVTPLALFL